MKQGAFIAVTTEHPIYEHYTEVDEATQKTVIPLALMYQRWDGLIGFPGGFIDGDENAKHAAIRELEEEIGVQLPLELAATVQFVCTHQNEKIAVHMYQLSVDFETFKSFMASAHKGLHFIAEGTPIAPQLMPYPKEKGLTAFLKNNFAFAVKEELHSLFQFLEWDKKYGSVVDNYDSSLEKKDTSIDM